MADPLRALVSEAFPHARITGNSARCNDIYGLEVGQSLYINLVDGSWHDKNTGERGRDIESLFVARKDLEKYRTQIALAMAWVAAGGGALAPVVSLRGKDVLVGDTRMPTQVKHPVHGVARPEDCYWYRSQVGTYLGCAARFIDKNGKKIVPSYVSVSRKGSPSTWHWTGFGGSGPLYNAMALLNPDNSHMPVIVFEGEKTAQAVVGADSAIATTWAGGTDNVRNVGWFELRGRDVTLCPDYDDAGVSAMEVIGNILRSEGCRVRIVPGEAVASALGVHSPPKGWDVADVVADPEVIARAILDEAVKSGDDVVDAPSFFTNARGEVKPSAANALLAVEGSTELEIVFNDDVKVVGYRTAPPWRGGGDVFDPMRDVDIIRLTYYLKQKHGVDFPRTGVLEGLLATADKNSFSPWINWLDGLKWDCVPRIDNVFDAIGCKVPDSGDEAEYMTFCSAYIFTGVVTRLYRPGIQMDMMPVLEGKQGIGKSRFIKTIAGMFTPGVDHSSYVSLDLGLIAGKGFGQKDAQMMISGAIFVEVEEMSQIDNTDVNAMKRIISVQSDKFRPPYGSNLKEYWRRCMLIGTTNRTDYLRDDTGNRRFLPIGINCGPDGLDMAWVLENRDQLFAEAVHRFREHDAAGTLKDLLDLPDSLRDYHSRVTNDRFIDDPWADVLRDYFLSTNVELGPDRMIAASKILEAVFDIKPAQQTSRVFKQLTTAARVVGMTHERVRQEGGSRRSMYRIPPKEKLGESPVATAARALADGGTNFSPFTTDDGDIKV